MLELPHVYEEIPVCTKKRSPYWTLGTYLQVATWNNIMMVPFAPGPRWLIITPTLIILNMTGPAVCMELPMRKLQRACMPIPRGKPVKATTFEDANLMAAWPHYRKIGYWYHSSYHPNSHWLVLQMSGHYRDCYLWIRIRCWQNCYWTYHGPLVYPPYVWCPYWGPCLHAWR